MAKTYVVKQKKSTIGCTKSQVKTVESLGLRGIGSQVRVSDNSANRGQIMKVQHLLEVSLEKIK